MPKVKSIQNWFLFKFQLTFNTQLISCIINAVQIGVILFHILILQASIDFNFCYSNYFVILPMLKQLKEIIGENVTSQFSIDGGSIASSQIIKTESGKTYFLKSYGSNKNILQCEINGLKELEKSKTIRIPKVIAVTDQFLLLEFIPTGRKRNDFSKTFGKQFAKMHKTISDKFGFYESNFIGSNPQVNIKQCESWVDFFWEHRLLFQFQLAEQNGYSNSEFRNLFNKLEKLFPTIIGGTEELPTLLHGDLLSGNFLVDGNNTPLLIDPAVYYGHREADLAMTKLFGGFDSDFYSSYNKEYPFVITH